LAHWIALAVVRANSLWRTAVSTAFDALFDIQSFLAVPAGNQVQSFQLRCGHAFGRFYINVKISHNLQNILCFQIREFMISPYHSITLPMERDGNAPTETATL